MIGKRIRGYNELAQESVNAAAVLVTGEKVGLYDLSFCARIALTQNKTPPGLTCILLVSKGDARRERIHLVCVTLEGNEIIIETCVRFIRGHEGSFSFP